MPGLDGDGRGTQATVGGNENDWSLVLPTVAQPLARIDAGAGRRAGRPGTGGLQDSGSDLFLGPP
jgi:hypothetical protein